MMVEEFRRSATLLAFCVGLGLAGCGGKPDTPGPNRTSGAPGARLEAATTPLPARPAGAKTLDDRDIPFTFAYAKPFVRGVDRGALPDVLAAVVIDRRDAILISDFGQALSDTEFGAILARKLREGGYRGVLELRVGDSGTLYSAVLEPGSGGARDIVAGQKVGAKRYWFTHRSGSWEISCQFTRARRRMMIRACDLAAGTLRFR